MIRDKIEYLNPEAILWDDLDEAIVGVSDDGRVVYDIDKMYRVFYNQNKSLMDFEEAVEYIDFNVVSAHVGDYTPIHIWGIPAEDYDE